MRRIISFPGLTGIFICLIGLCFLILGAWLAALGGSPYYVIAGILLLVSGILLALRRSAGLWLYALVFIGTIIWALYEVGLDGWQLMPRLLMLAVLGIWCSLPWVVRPVSEHTGTARALMTTGLIYVLAIGGVFWAGWHITAQRYVLNENSPALQAAVSKATPTDATGAGGEWRYYGGTMAGDRYSSLDQITRGNVAKLKLAWSYHSGDLPGKGENSGGKEFNFEATPIKVGQRLYFCTPHRTIIALNATSGKEIWRFNPKSDTSSDDYLSCRGVAYYQSPDQAIAGQTQKKACAQRIISTDANARMFALDADTGKLCPDFGNGGFVSLKDHMGKVPPGFHFITSQPLVIDGRIVLGGWIHDNQARGEPSGVVRAYDADTGKLAWAWDMGKPDPTAPLKPGEAYTRGTPNGWGTYTADPELGLIYIPLGNATPDYYGADRRPFDDKYSSSLVALDAKTGQERWHFQTVHHDLWDFDLPIGPSLVNVPGPNGQVIPALVQTTKRGELFMLDRRTGKPIAKVQEKPVPTKPFLKGERISPTQPYSVGLPSLAPKDLTERDMWGATAIDQLWCRIEFHRDRYNGQFTPPALGTNIAYPAFDGVMDWYGATIDPVRKLLIANTNYIPFIVTAMTQADAIKQGDMKAWGGWDSGTPPPKPKTSVNPQYGTPFPVIVKPWLSPLHVPCHAPPWGTLVAIDLLNHKIAWQHPVGTTRDTNLFGVHDNLPLPVGVFTMGGNLATAGGLIFMGATQDDYLRAFDERTGKVVWKARLPAGGQATPMTYKGQDGQQYVVIAAGGHGGLETRSGDAVLAYTLPDGAS